MKLAKVKSRSIKLSILLIVISYSNYSLEINNYSSLPIEDLNTILEIEYARIQNKINLSDEDAQELVNKIREYLRTVK